MLIIEILILIVVIIIGFWQGSLIYAQLLGAPSVNSSHQAVVEALKLAQLKAGETVVDLGCGNGSTLLIAAQEFQAKGVGVERSPFYYLLAKINVAVHGLSKSITISYGDFKKVERELREANVVYLYLLNSVLARIEGWVFSNLKKDTRVVSLAFSFKTHKPVIKSSAITLGRETKIELYQVK